jgi:uncharacterized protein YycO
MIRNEMNTTALFMLLTVLTGCGPRDLSNLQDGDIIFHTSRSSQSEALRRAMNSPYTHMGIIFIEDDAPVVYEAVGPVKRTPLEEWVGRGEEGHFVVKRWSGAGRHLDEDAVARLKAAGAEYAGRSYDPYFEWSDDRIYCSELVWKMYESALGVEIGTLQTFADFDLSDPVVVKKLRERFPDQVPLDEVVISPASMFESDKLVTVCER